MSAQAILDGQCILNTRPAHQQTGLRALLESQGARVLSFPTIDIVAAEATPFHLSLVTNIAHYHIALFVSRNAVDGAFTFLDVDQLPDDLLLGVIGGGSYTALAHRVKDLDHRLIRSEPYNSEGLLAATELQQVDGKNILIFRGQQGRTLLAEELGKRGATVNHCEVYQRKVPEYSHQDFANLASQQFPTLLIFTSTEGMENLLPLVDDQSRAKLLRTPWLLISERMRESAANLGHNAEIIIAVKASDEGIQHSLSEWVKRTHTIYD